jgi:hypothetical protein
MFSFVVHYNDIRPLVAQESLLILPRLARSCVNADAGPTGRPSRNPFAGAGAPSGRGTTTTFSMIGDGHELGCQRRRWPTNW